MELIHAKHREWLQSATDRSILLAMTIWKVILSEGTSHSITAESIEVSADGSTVRFSVRAPGLGSIITVASVTTTPGMIIVNSDHKQS